MNDLSTVKPLYPEAFPQTDTDDSDPAPAQDEGRAADRGGRADDCREHDHRRPC